MFEKKYFANIQILLRELGGKGRRREREIEIDR